MSAPSDTALARARKAAARALRKISLEELSIAEADLPRWARLRGDDAGRLARALLACLNLGPAVEREILLFAAEDNEWHASQEEELARLDNNPASKLRSQSSAARFRARAAALRDASGKGKA